MTQRPPRIFISYSHRDEDWKNRLVAHLRVLATEDQVDVWDDRRIEAGAAWRAQIEEAIDRADAAILLVSADFLTSPFIRDEEVARILNRRSTDGLRVVPLIVRPCAWTQIGWLKDLQARPKDGRPLSAGSDHQIEDDLTKFVQEIARVEPIPPVPPMPPVPEPGLFARLKRQLGAVALALAPAMIVAPLFAASRALGVATPIQLDLVARAVSFTVADGGPTALLGASTVLSKLVIEECDTVSLPPINIARGGPSGMKAAGAVHFRCDPTVPGARLILRPSDAGAAMALGTLGQIVAEAGNQVSFDVSGFDPPNVRLEVSRPASYGFTVAPDVPFEIVSEFAALDGLALADGLAPAVVTYQASLADPQGLRLATVKAERGLKMVLVPARAQDVDGLFRKNVDIPVGSLSLFQRSHIEDRYVSTAIRGTLSYPGRPEMGVVDIQPGDSVTLGGVSGLRLTRLWVDRADAGLGFGFHGEVGELRIDGEDRRLSLFDWMLFSGPLKLAAALAAVAWQVVWLRRFWRPLNARR